ncbi:hypothetical protein GQR58_012388 [Nymphon striatum]|nr:hypothetical protein GQR58_012388 [Nymphon striatum]
MDPPFLTRVEEIPSSLAALPLFNVLMADSTSILVIFGIGSSSPSEKEYVGFITDINMPKSTASSLDNLCDMPSWFEKLRDLFITLYNSSVSLKEDRDDTIFEKFVSALEQELSSTAGMQHFLEDKEISAVIEHFFMIEDELTCDQLSTGLRILNKAKELLCEILVIEKVNSDCKLLSCILQKVLNSLSIKPESVLQTLIKACSESVSVCEMLKVNFQGISCLLKFLQESDNSSVSNQIGVLLASLICSNKNLNEIESSIKIMLEWRKYETVLIFSTEVLKQYPERTECMDFIFSPIKEIVSPHPDIEDQHKFHFKSTIESRRILCLALSCMKILCSCVPCPLSVSHASSILSLLNACCFENCSTILSNDRVKIDAIELLSNFYSLKSENINVNDILHTWVKMISKHKSNCSLMIKILNWLDKITDLIVDNDEETVDLEEVGKILHWHLGDTRWEIQDSIIELITKMAKKTESLHLQRWLVQQKFHRILCDLIFTFSPEAYVIASSLKAVASYIHVDELNTAILNDCSVSSDQFYERIIVILQKSNDYLIRRSASEIMSNYCVENVNVSFKDDKVLFLMSVICCRDLDWCVKVNSLSFWSSLLDKVFSLYEDTDFALNVLDRNGFVTSIVSSFLDHDLSVQKAAGTILKSVQQRLKINVSIDSHELPEINNRKEGTDSDFLIADPHISVADREKIINDVIDLDECYRLIRLLKPKSDDESKAEEDKSVTPEINQYNMDHLNEILKKINFDYLSKNLEKPADTYCENFSLLIDDLMNCIAEVGNTDIKDVVIDCY